MHSTVTNRIDNSSGKLLVLGLAVALAVGVCVPGLAQLNTQNTPEDAVLGSQNSSVPVTKLASPSTLTRTASAGDSSAAESSAGKAATVDPWIQQAELPSTSLEFGASVAVSGSTAAVGAIGSASVFVERDGTWSQQSLPYTMGSPYSVPPVAVSGSTVVVGGSNGNLGNVSVFVESGGTWTQQALLTASDGEVGDGFGNSVAIHGSTILVGAPYHQVGSNVRQGAAYVFVENGGTWTQQAELTASDGTANDLFGSSVGLTASRVVVGAPVDEDFSSSPGAAYVFSESGGTWTQQVELTESDGEADDEFGVSVAVSDNTVVVGAPQHAVGGAYVFAPGAACVFVESGGTWSQRAELTDFGGTQGGRFGSSVAVQGATILVGAPYFNVGSNEWGGRRSCSRKAAEPGASSR
jgi:nucleoside-specific outer membrane channel protein Tsx